MVYDRCLANTRLVRLITAYMYTKDRNCEQILRAALWNFMSRKSLRRVNQIMLQSTAAVVNVNAEHPLSAQ